MNSAYRSRIQVLTEILGSVLATTMMGTAMGRVHHSRKIVVMYFMEILDIRYVLAIIAIGSVLIFVGLDEPELAGLVLVGLFVTGAGILGCSLLFVAPSDREIDTVIDEELDNVAKRAMERLTLHVSDLVSETIYVIGVESGILKVQKSRYVEGKTIALDIRQLA